jgi:hypothetical protein
MLSTMKTFPCFKALICQLPAGMAGMEKEPSAPVVVAADSQPLKQIDTPSTGLAEASTTRPVTLYPELNWAQEMQSAKASNISSAFFL